MPRTKAFDEKEVLEKAMELFWRQGYHATSIQNLVDHLGINRASLYDTYGGKEALFEKAFDRYVAVSSLEAIKLLDRHDSVKAAFREFFLLAAVEAARDKENRGCFVVNTTTELVPNEEKWSKRVKENRQAFEKLFLKYLRKGVAGKEINADKDLKAIASYFFTFYNGLKVVSKIHPSEEELSRVVGLVLSVLD